MYSLKSILERSMARNLKTVMETETIVEFCLLVFFFLPGLLNLNSYITHDIFRQIAVHSELYFPTSIIN